jgi:hypothetical protein
MSRITRGFSGIPAGSSGGNGNAAGRAGAMMPAAIPENLSMTLLVLADWRTLCGSGTSPGPVDVLIHQQTYGRISVATTKKAHG